MCYFAVAVLRGLDCLVVFSFDRMFSVCWFDFVSSGFHFLVVRTTNPKDISFTGSAVSRSVNNLVACFVEQ